MPMATSLKASDSFDASDPSAARLFSFAAASLDCADALRKLHRAITLESGRHVDALHDCGRREFLGSGTPVPACLRLPVAGFRSIYSAERF